MSKELKKDLAKKAQRNRSVMAQHSMKMVKNLQELFKLANPHNPFCEMQYDHIIEDLEKDFVWVKSCSKSYNKLVKELMEIK